MNNLEQYRKRNPFSRKPFAVTLYIEYCNDFPTLGNFAEHYNATISEMENIIKEGKHWHSLPVIVAKD